jgi:hypothetical protein
MEGHFGISVTIKKIKSLGYNWKTLVKDVVRVIRTCSICQRHTIAKKGFNPMRTRPLLRQQLLLLLLILLF